MKIFLTGGCGFIGSNYVLNQVLEHNRSHLMTLPRRHSIDLYNQIINTGY